MKQKLALLVLHKGRPSAEKGSLDLERGALTHEFDPSHELLEVGIKEDVDAILKEFDHCAGRGVV